MDQPIANISFQDIERIIERDYSQYDKAMVLEVLNQYSSDSVELHFRVWAGALKLSDGHLEKLRKNIGIAKSDYRDILAIAEYPKYSDQIGYDKNAFTKEEIDAIIKEDWNQYQKWLNA